MKHRLGELSFLNALPFVLDADVLDALSFEKTSLAPTGLNHMMLEKKLDVSPVSSAFYLRHSEQFVLLDDIAVGAHKPVESVLLFLPKDISLLQADVEIAVPDTSETSIALMQYILLLKTGEVFRNLVTYPRGKGHIAILENRLTLAIGDEALMLKEQFESAPKFDLAEIWKAETGLPFVFAVWVAQADWAQQNPEALKAINAELVGRKLAFQADPHVQSQLLDDACRRSPDLPSELLIRYLTDALSYDLTKEHLEGLLWFEHVLKWLDDDKTESNERHGFGLPLEHLHR